MFVLWSRFSSAPSSFPIKLVRIPCLTCYCPPSPFRQCASREGGPFIGPALCSPVDLGPLPVLEGEGLYLTASSPPSSVMEQSLEFNFMRLWLPSDTVSPLLTHSPGSLLKSCSRQTLCRHLYSWSKVGFSSSGWGRKSLANKVNCPARTI